MNIDGIEIVTWDEFLLWLKDKIRHTKNLFREEESIEIQFEEEEE